MTEDDLPESWRDAVGQFTDHLVYTDKKPRTIELRVYQLGRFARAHPAGPEQVTSVQVRKYLARTEWAPATRAVVRASLTTFYRWAVAEEGLFGNNPTLALPKVATAVRTPNPVPRQIVREAIKTAEPRVKLMIRLAADAGLSAMEIATARQSDLQERDGDYLIRTQARAGSVRLVPLPPTLAEDLRYLGGDYLFPNPKNGDSMGPAYITRLLSRALPRGYTSESLRQAYFSSTNPARLSSWRDASYHAPERAELLDAKELEDAKTLHAHFRRIERFMDSDPATAITECKNVIETLAKRLLKDFGVSFNEHANMGTLRELVIDTLDLRASSVEGSADASEQIAGLVESSFSGLNQLRNNLGIGHGDQATGKVEPYHARLAFNVTVTLSEYLLARWREVRG